MKDKLGTLEDRIRALIEVRLVSVLPGHKIEQVVAQQLAAAMLAHDPEQGGPETLPNVYTLVANPATVEKWQAISGFADTLLEILTTAAKESGLRLSAPPEITLATEETLENGEVRVIASNKVDLVVETKGVPVENAAAVDTSEPLPSNAFLIVDGVKVFPLTQSVVNIGRRQNNQLVVDDPRVSRNHAQLRAIKGRFVLFDLDSTGGTFINGQRVNQSILYPGDVISLAGVPLIFGQDNPTPQGGGTQTEPPRLQAGERPTVILRNPDSHLADTQKK